MRLVSGLTDTDAADAIVAGGGSEVSSIPELRLHIVEVPADIADAAVAEYSSDPRVQSVDRDRSRDAEATPNDPAYGSQWALPQIGWDQVYGTTSATGFATIAVLDTGVQSSDVPTGPGWSAFGSDPAVDPNGHGTWVASIAAATPDNGAGIAGVGFDMVDVMPVQVLSADGTGQDSDIIAGLVWAADHGADVAVMAFSNPGYSQALQDAVNYAWNHGVVVVAAAGNDGATTPNYPAGDAKVVGVGATDQNDQLWSGSNSSNAVFLTAPGVDIKADSVGGGTDSVTGTSMSAAMRGQNAKTWRKKRKEKETRKKQTLRQATTRSVKTATNNKSGHADMAYKPRTDRPDYSARPDPFNINTKDLVKNKTYVYLITLNETTIEFRFGLK